MSELLCILPRQDEGQERGGCLQDEDGLWISAVQRQNGKIQDTKRRDDQRLHDIGFFPGGG